jgi:hypothetical protein
LTTRKVVVLVRFFVRRFRLPFNLKALSQEKKQECIDAGKVQNIVEKISNLETRDS